MRLLLSSHGRKFSAHLESCRSKNGEGDEKPLKKEGKEIWREDTRSLEKLV